jgi:hypothetical protein
MLPSEMRCFRCPIVDIVYDAPVTLRMLPSENRCTRNFIVAGATHACYGHPGRLRASDLTVLCTVGGLVGLTAVGYRRA